MKLREGVDKLGLSKRTSHEEEKTRRREKKKKH